MTEKVPSITAFGPSVHGFSDPPRNLYFLKNTLSLSFGGGPASAVAAMYLLRQGITPVITERDDHPLRMLLGGGTDNDWYKAVSVGI